MEPAKHSGPFFIVAAQARHRNGSHPLQVTEGSRDTQAMRTVFHVVVAAMEDGYLYKCSPDRHAAGLSCDRAHNFLDHSRSGSSR